MGEPSRKSHGLDITAIFGAAPKKGGFGGGDEDARDALKKASGWDDDTLDALHEYVMSCMPEDEGPKSSKEPDMGDDEDSKEDY